MALNKTCIVDWASGLSETFLYVLGFNNCVNCVLGSPTGLVLGRNRRERWLPTLCPPSFIVLRLIWPSSGTFQYNQLTSEATTVSARAA